MKKRKFEQLPDLVENNVPLLTEDKKRFSMKIRGKLILAFMLVGLIPFTIISIMSFIRGSQSLYEQTLNRLTSVRELKKHQIANYFNQSKIEVKVLKDTVGTLRQEAFNKLKAVHQIKKHQIEDYFRDRFKLLDDVKMNLRFTEGIKLFTDAFKLGLNSPEYKKLSADREKGFSVFIENLGFHDVFLIDADGNVVYTAAKESDLGANLNNSPLKDSGLARVFDNSHHQSAIEDFSFYEPSNEPAAFIATPLIDSSDKYWGSAVFQISSYDINIIMHERAGLKKTGETYLVGPDKRMRSDSYLDPENHSVVASFIGTIEKNGVDTEAVHDAIVARSGAKVIQGYTNNHVLSVYSPVDIPGLDWVIIAEIDIVEAFCPVDENGEYFYAKYIKEHGYNDLFLINPDGYCFYTVTQKDDYQTNLVNGKYSSSNLGKLTRQVLHTKEFGLADFEPYAPRNNYPESFIAQPVVYNGKVEVVVALKLSIDAINDVLQQREGMGDTGDTYLVGEDYLMRSNSYRDPVNHSVVASFDNTQTGKVDTEVSRAALNGKTGTKVITDYDGNIVLSAYTPLTVGDLKWALLTEIDKAEIFEPIKHLKWFVVIIAAVCVIVIITVSILFAHSISNPLTTMVSVVKKITEGDFTKRVDIDREDEIGILAKNVNCMVDYLRIAILKFKDNPESLVSTSEKRPDLSS